MYSASFLPSSYALRSSFDTPISVSFFPRGPDYEKRIKVETKCLGSHPLSSRLKPVVGHVQEKNRSDFPPGSGQVLLRMLRSKHVLNVFDEMERPHVNKESGISRIVGGSPEEEAAALREFKERFERRESVEGLEREKTPEEMETIRAIAQAMPEFLARYHAQAVPIAPEQIHFIDVARLPDEARER